MPPARTVSGAEAAMMMNTRAGVDRRRRSRCVFSIWVSSSNGYPQCALPHFGNYWLFVHAAWFPVPDLVTTGQECTQKQDLCTCVTVVVDQMDQDQKTYPWSQQRSFHDLRHWPVIRSTVPTLPPPGRPLTICRRVRVDPGRQSPVLARHRRDHAEGRTLPVCSSRNHPCS